MSGCVLRAYGKKFDIDLFLNKSRLILYNKYYRGDPVPSKVIYKKDFMEVSGFNILLSNKTDKNFKGQLKDVKEFILKNKKELKRLKKYEGVEKVILDFAIWHNMLKFGAHCTSFDSDFLYQVCDIGLEIQISCYNNTM